MSSGRKIIYLLATVCLLIFSIGCQKEENIKEVSDIEIFDVEIMVAYNDVSSEKSHFTPHAQGQHLSRMCALKSSSK